MERTYLISMLEEMVNMKTILFILIAFSNSPNSSSEKMSCPLDNINFSENDLACIKDVSSYLECGKLCHNMYLPDSCRYWSWCKLNYYCCLKSSNSGLSNNDDWVSGDSDCYWVGVREWKIQGCLVKLEVKYFCVWNIET